MAYGSLVGSVCFTLEVGSVKGNEFEVQKSGDFLLKGAGQKRTHSLGHVTWQYKGKRKLNDGPRKRFLLVVEFRPTVTYPPC